MSAPLTVPPKPSIQKLSFSHEAIIRFMLANPNMTQHAVAQEFGYSDAWLSIIIHSDAFQAKWKELSGQADQAVLADIPAKMRGAASLAVEALGEQVQLAAQEPGNKLHRSFLLETSDMLLSKLGYGAKPANGGGGVQVNLPAGSNANITVVDAKDLERARARMLEQRANGATVVDGTAERIPDPAAS